MIISKSIRKNRTPELQQRSQRRLSLRPSQVIFLAGCLLSVLALAQSPERARPFDFRISSMGQEGALDFVGLGPAAVFNPTRGETLVAWTGDDDSGALVLGELEVYVQRLSRAGVLLGNRIRVSEVGGTGDPQYAGLEPQIAYDSTHDEYLVVWPAHEVGMASIELEIYARRLSGEDATPVAAAQRISNMGGGIGDDQWRADAPSVSYSPEEDEYLVVWEGTDTDLVAFETEIYSQRLEGGTGLMIGGNTRLSDLGGIGDLSFDAEDPDVAYCPSSNEYWVVFSGNDDSGSLVSSETEIFLQRVDAATGMQIGPNDQRVSTQAGTGVPFFSSHDPSVACLADSGIALVVWRGDSNLGGMVDNEFEIFGQLLDAQNGLEIEDDFRISDMGGLGNLLFGVGSPSLTALEDRNLFFVTWSGKDTRPEITTDESEIFGQMVDQEGNEVGENDQLVTLVGDFGDSAEGAFEPRPVYTGDRLLVVFFENQDYRSGIETEIAGQILEFTLFADGFETGDTTAWSTP